MAWAKLQEHARTNKLGGGKARLKKLKEQGKLSARERINHLVDDPNAVHEIGILAAENYVSRIRRVSLGRSGRGSWSGFWKAMCYSCQRCRRSKLGLGFP